MKPHFLRAALREPFKAFVAGREVRATHYVITHDGKNKNEVVYQDDGTTGLVASSRLAFSVRDIEARAAASLAVRPARPGA